MVRSQSANHPYQKLLRKSFSAPKITCKKDKNREQLQSANHHQECEKPFSFGWKACIISLRSDFSNSRAYVSKGAGYGTDSRGYIQTHQCHNERTDTKNGNVHDHKSKNIISDFTPNWFVIETHRNDRRWV